MLRLRRIYDPPGESGEYRVLVDRLWPRGVSKDRANLDLWMKDLAPTTSLRKFFGHDPARYPTFRARYRRQLATRSRRTALADLAEKAREGPVVLLYAASDTEHNHARVVAETLVEEYGVRLEPDADPG